MNEKETCTLEKRVAALEAQIQRLPSELDNLQNKFKWERKYTFLSILIGVALSDLILSPLINFLLALLRK